MFMYLVCRGRRGGGGGGNRDVRQAKRRHDELFVADFLLSPFGSY